MKNIGRMMVLLLLLCLTACTAGTPQAETQASPTAVASAEPLATASPVDACIAGMSTRERVAQLFFVKPENLIDVSAVTVAGERTKQTLLDYPVGGVILFDANLQTPEQTQALTAGIRQAVDIPPFIGVDEEGGKVARISSNPAMGYPRLPAAGSLKTVQKAGQNGYALGRMLAELGFNLNFAPVADVNTNPHNPVIGDRAYSSDPQEAAELVAAEVDGLHRANVAAVLKHFPGHGDTSQDSHKTLPRVSHDLERLRQAEFAPFTAGLNAGADMVMVGHIALPEVTGTVESAVFSRQIVTGLLKGELGCGGVVITDALDMGGAADRSPGRMAVDAIQAGCDMLLMPSDFYESFDAVLAAVESGEIPQERLQDALHRILTVKAQRGLLP